MLLQTPLGRLRLVGWIEGISFLVLLFIAMPLKYLGDKPFAVTVAGALHGAFFLLFCLILLHTALDRHWSFRQTVIPFIAALLPFGPFVIDRRLRADEDATSNRAV